MKKIIIGIVFIVVCCGGCSHQLGNISHYDIEDEIEKGFEDIDEDKPFLVISVSFNPEKYKIHTIFPQLAVWLAYETDDGGLVNKTVFATQGAGSNNWVQFGGGFVRRPEATPVWRYAREKEADSDIDAVTSATPVGHLLTLYIQMPEKIKNNHIDVYAEVNVSFDYNLFYFFHPINGQPSVIWKAGMNTDQLENGQVTDAEIVGHGSVWGKKADIKPNTSHVTTAKQLLHYIKVGYFTGDDAAGAAEGQSGDLRKNS